MVRNGKFKPKASSSSEKPLLSWVFHNEYLFFLRFHISFHVFLLSPPSVCSIRLTLDGMLGSIYDGRPGTVGSEAMID